MMDCRETVGVEENCCYGWDVVRGGDDMFDFGLVMFKVPVWAIREDTL